MAEQYHVYDHLAANHGGLLLIVCFQERMREELGYRTAMMNHEMEKWRQQAAMTANAVLEAKNEVGAHTKTCRT